MASKGYNLCSEGCKGARGLCSEGCKGVIILGGSKSV